MEDIKKQIKCSVARASTLVILDELDILFKKGLISFPQAALIANDMGYIRLTPKQVSKYKKQNGE